MSLRNAIKWLLTSSVLITTTYFPEDWKQQSFIFPSTWHECWFIENVGHSIQDIPCDTCTSYMQNFHSLKERLNVWALIVSAYYNKAVQKGYKCNIIEVQQKLQKKKQWSRQYFWNLNVVLLVKNRDCFFSLVFETYSHIHIFIYTI